MPLINLDPILAAVRSAAALARRVQETYLADGQAQKGERDPVTLADYGSQALLLRVISREFPDDGVLAEEESSQFGTLLTDAQRDEIVQLIRATLDEPVTEDDIKRWLDHGRGLNAQRVWAVDPIDGTKGFIAKRRYSIAVGLLDGGLPIAGVLGSPGYPSPDGHGLLFHAQRGAAHAELMSGGKPARIAVSTRTKPQTWRAVESVERDHAALERMARIYAALGIDKANVEGVDSQDKYAMVACGDADIFLRLPREQNPVHKLWDHVAGATLVQAAGGVVTDLDGSLLDFTTGAILKNNIGMVVTSGVDHERVLAAVQEIGVFG